MTQFKITAKLVNGKHSVVVFDKNDGSEYLYFTSEYGIHTACVVAETLKKDINAEFNIKDFPLVLVKINKKGNAVRFTK